MGLLKDQNKNLVESLLTSTKDAAPTNGAENVEKELDSVIRLDPEEIGIEVIKFLKGSVRVPLLLSPSKVFQKKF